MACRRPRRDDSDPLRRPYKPSAIRGYERSLRKRLLPEFGDMRLNDLRRPQLQRLAERLIAEGKSASTLGNLFMPLPG